MGPESYDSLERNDLIRQIVERDHALVAQREAIALRDEEISKLQNLIHNANRKAYGAKTEKLTSDQLNFTFEIPVEQLPLPEEQIVVEKHTRTVRKGRKPLPSDLPREEVVYEPEESQCGCCGKELSVIGEVRTEELEKIPAQLKVIEHVRIKKACSHCKKSPVLVAPLPPTALPFERARPGAGLVADILVSKFVDHLPLYRQEEQYRRLGIELSRKRLCDWVRMAVELLEPIYNALLKEILTFPYVQADETTIKVQDGEEERKCHTGYLWGVHGPPNLVWFKYAESRAAKVPLEIFKEYRGTVQTDAYVGYDKVFLPETIERLSCLAHIRRKFVEVQKVGGSDCAAILKCISGIYQAERSAKTVEARLAVRKAKTQSTMEQLYTFMETSLLRTLPKHPLAGALKYALSQKDETFRILTHGAFELDNNGIERLIRPIAVGRKNYLFAGSHDGAHRAAVLYSLLGTCKLHKLNPWEYLRDVLVRVHVHPASDVASLLPHRWKVNTAA